MSHLASNIRHTVTVGFHALGFHPACPQYLQKCLRNVACHGSCPQCWQIIHAALRRETQSSVTGANRSLVGLQITMRRLAWAIRRVRNTAAVGLAAADIHRHLLQTKLVMALPSDLPSVWAAVTLKPMRTPRETQLPELVCHQRNSKGARLQQAATQAPDT